MTRAHMNISPPSGLEALYDRGDLAKNLRTAVCTANHGLLKMCIQHPLFSLDNIDQRKAIESAMVELTIHPSLEEESPDTDAFVTTLLNISGMETVCGDCLAEVSFVSLSRAWALINGKVFYNTKPLSRFYESVMRLQIYPFLELKGMNKLAYGFKPAQIARMIERRMKGAFFLPELYQLIDAILQKNPDAKCGMSWREKRLMKKLCKTGVLSTAKLKKFEKIVRRLLESR